MAVYMISYDIKVKDSFEYDALYEAIKGIGPWCWPLASVWFVDTTTKDESDIFNMLKPYLTLKESDGDLVMIRRCTQDGDGHYKNKDIAWMNSPNRTWRTPPY